MPTCSTRCPKYSTDSIINAWLDIRDHFGPSVSVGDDLYVEDIGDWTAWALTNNVSALDVVKFGRWLIWKCSFGTTDYGRLPSSRRHDHVGHCWAPCPFDSNTYDAIRSEVWLGYTPTSLSNHGNFYMKNAYSGRWGLECTYSGCPYLIEHGRPYFYA